MSARRSDEASAPLREEGAREEVENDPLSRVLEQVEPKGPDAHARPAALGVAKAISIAGDVVGIAMRSGRTTAARLGDVEAALVKRAIAHGDRVLVEYDDEGAIVVGVVQTKLPREIELRGRTITIEADEEVLVRAGTSAVRLRKDGDVEVVGSRVVALSRGLFRLVGRVLRLN